VQAKRGAALRQRLLERVGNPLEWNDIDKALVVQALQGPMAFVMLLRGRYMLQHPESEPYYDRGVLAILIRMLAVHVGLTVVFVVVGIWLRHAQRGRRAYLYVVVLYWWLMFAWIAYLHGPATTPLWAVFPLLGFFTLLLFDLRLALSGMLSALVFIYMTAVGERLGLVPYAPLFSAWPMAGDRLSDEWFWSSMLWPVIASGVAFAAFVMILHLNRRQARALAAATQQLRTDVQDAAQYVRSVLPAPLDGTRGVIAEWSFVPSAELGGDAFTYCWIDADHFMIALLDVCGHGVGSALHGISALHALRPRGLLGVDLRDPGAVIAAMNDAFAMEDHNDLYLTLWYGVYHRPTRQLRFTTGGHPPAVLLTGPTRAAARVHQLGTKGLTVGVVAGTPYEVQEAALDAFAELFVFSDGTFEIERPGNGMLPWNDFVAALASPPPDGVRKTDAMLHYGQQMAGRDQLEDDFSLVRLEFGPDRTLAHRPTAAVADGDG
jgi:serine phosphatase RsbU (regulator of sigma subunit)